MMNVLGSIDELTPQQLTQILKAKAELDQGKVIRVDRENLSGNQGYTADITRLRLTYSADAVGRLPQKLILKMPKAGLHEEYLSRGAREAVFYQAVAQVESRLPVPVIYDAAYDVASHRSHILMEDLSESHFQRPLPIPPSNQLCRRIMESCARIHAAWWNDDRLGTGIGDRLTLEKANAISQRLYTTIPDFFDYLGDALLPFQRKIIEDIAASNFLPRLSQRLCDLRRVTLVHGDVHTGNLLFPREGQAAPVIFIDWQLWDINVAAMDLAFMMALHWNTERRALLEKSLLHHYYQHLTANGVPGYSLDELWHDYRESVVVCCLIPIGQFRRKSPAGVVWFGLQDSLAAFKDLNCHEVLQ